MEDEVLLDIEEDVENNEEEVVEVEVEDEDEEVEVNSTDEEEEKPQKKQSSGKNKAQAEARRKREAKEKESSLKDEAYKKGVMETLGNVNPYTHEPMEDDVDYQIYNEMKEAEKKGYDPLDAKDMYAFRKEKMLLDQKSKEQELQAEKRRNDDVVKFMEKYQDVDVYDLLQDANFQSFAEDLLGEIPLITIYEKYTKFNNEVSTKAKELAQKKTARERASTGSYTDTDSGEDLYSLEELAKLSRKEIEENYEKVMRSKNKNFYKK